MINFLNLKKLFISKKFCGIAIFSLLSLFSPTSSALIDKDTMVIVMATDNNCCAPTAVTIQTIKQTTLHKKCIIIFTDGVTDENSAKLKKMEDMSTEVVIHPVSKRYIELMDRYKSE